MNDVSRRLRLPILALCLAVAMGGCGGRPHGVLTPQPRVAGTTPVELLVATTRSPEGAAPGDLFTGERGRSLAFADIAISIPPDGARQIGEVQWPSASPGDPAREFVTLRADPLGQQEAVRRFDARIVKTPKRQALVFVHGFNTLFAEAVFRFAQIVHDSGTNALPVLFTWPSRGKLLDYGYDHESASYSRDALEHLLRTLAKDPSVGEISILAHSMGNWVTLEALRQMAIRDRGLAPKIKNVMLAAPDVDYDVFSRQIAEIDEHRAIFTLFVSREDEALAASRRVWGDKVRLGAIDPQREPFKDTLAERRFTVVDLTTVKSSDPLGHGTFAQSPEIVRSIGARLAEGQTLADSQSGVGERLGQVATGAASAVGAAASVAVSTPFAVVDPRTRENLGDQLQRLGEQMGDTATAGADVVARPLR
ncbi:alpha/beta hydrolase [Methylosinus sp. H3A]|uniref:alpha/beta hydrolase n=1 Tax=Methylosinus sp. H3A TaxID=2785786 RepID=UPI0018C1F6D5|nr:alpha/beta hydrolase [Methylosinus sp. H3A]MBG0810471.1 alpha/beta hydrolase [Methylosinus sp. H3A]